MSKHDDRRYKLTYWVARIALNGAASGIFYVALGIIDIEFSWPLYWCAFAVYVVLSLGDMLMDEIWPPATTNRVG